MHEDTLFSDFTDSSNVIYIRLRLCSSESLQGQIIDGLETVTEYVINVLKHKHCCQAVLFPETDILRLDFANNTELCWSY